MSPPILEIKDLYVNYRIYRGILKVLNGVNFTVSRGEKVGLIGEAGCGKTTLVKAVMGILAKNAIVPKGEIIILGKELSKMTTAEKNTYRRKSFAMIFEDPTATLNPVVKIGDQMTRAIEYSLKEKSSWSSSKILKETAKKLAVEALKRVRMPDPERILDSYPLELSGGMRQRVVIAMAISRADDLIIADEPTTSLDVTIGTQILRLLGDLTKKKNLSFILISHALGAVRGLVDKVAVMYAGNIIEEAEVESFFSDPLHPYSRKLLESVPRLTGGGVPQGIRGEVPNYINPPEGCRFNPRCGYMMPICAKSKPPLFDVSGRKVACFLYGSEKT